MFTISDTIEGMLENNEYPPKGITTEGIIPYLKRLGPNISGIHTEVSIGLTTYHLLENLPNITKVFIMEPLSELARNNIQYNNISKTRIFFVVSPVELLEIVDYLYIGPINIYDSLQGCYKLVRPQGLVFGENFTKNYPELERFRKDNKITNPVSRVTNESWLWNTKRNT